MWQPNLSRNDDVTTLFTTRISTVASETVATFNNVALMLPFRDKLDFPDTWMTRHKYRHIILLIRLCHKWVKLQFWVKYPFNLRQFCLHQCYVQDASSIFSFLVFFLLQQVLVGMIIYRFILLFFLSSFFSVLESEVRLAGLRLVTLTERAKLLGGERVFSPGTCRDDTWREKTFPNRRKCKAAR